MNVVNVFGNQKRHIREKQTIVACPGYVVFSCFFCSQRQEKSVAGNTYHTSVKPLQKQKYQCIELSSMRDICCIET